MALLLGEVREYDSREGGFLDHQQDENRAVVQRATALLRLRLRELGADIHQGVVSRAPTSSLTLDQAQQLRDDCLNEAYAAIETAAYEANATQSALLYDLGQRAIERWEADQARDSAIVAASQAGCTWRQIAAMVPGLSHEGARQIVVRHNARHGLPRL
ncbi:MAG TPA: hypothetical protein VK486_06310 [Thermoleophilaceae bacterium]|nr:hypothetical protein [Thermoleophilaceae bacterium]